MALYRRRCIYDGDVTLRRWSSLTPSVGVTVRTSESPFVVSALEKGLLFRRPFNSQHIGHRVAIGIRASANLCGDVHRGIWTRWR